MCVKKAALVLIVAFVVGCSSDEPERRQQDDSYEDPPATIIRVTEGALDAVEKVVGVKMRIKNTEERVFESLRIIEQLTKEHKPRDLKTEQLLVDQYRKQQLPLMLEWGNKLSRAKNKFIADWKKHITAVNKAPAVFRQCREEYLVWADDQDDAKFKKIYEDMADASESWAKAMERRSATLNKMHDDFVSNTKLIDDSVIFLSRLQDFLKTIPDAGRAVELQNFMKEVDKYLEAFQRTINSFKDFSDKLKENEYGKEKPLA